MRPLADTDLRISELCLGGNVFGWTADEAESFAVLDAYIEAGGNFIDTADVYPAWAPGNSGGESETIIGRWMAARGNRDQLVIATKVCAHQDFRGLSAANIRAAARASLQRLGTDRIDLYYAHYDDPATPVAESVEALGGLVTAGQVRWLGASNFGPQRLAESLAAAAALAVPRYAVIQPRYSLVERAYEEELAPLAARERLACLPYAALAAGFLTGKYRDGRSDPSPRAAEAGAYLDHGGAAVLRVLDRVAAGHGVAPAAVALAWLAAQPGVAAPIASARTPAQLAELLPFVGLELSAAELQDLSQAHPAASAARS
jgi:aryl-alcohol dehydrogenase-like predicted oxidoreductase